MLHTDAISQTKTLNFSEGKKAVTLCIDEVYTPNHVEYQNGTFVVLTEDDVCSVMALQKEAAGARNVSGATRGRWGKLSQCLS